MKITLDNVDIEVPGEIVCKRAFAYNYDCLSKNINDIQNEWSIFTKELLFSKVSLKEIEILFSAYLNNKAENKLHNK